jgi:hypothetical protein
MRRGVVRLSHAAVGIAVALSASIARAELCAAPDLIETFPADGASNVPTNTILRARYAPTAAYLDEVVTFRGPDPGGSEITVGFRPEDTTCVAPLPGSFCFNAAEGLLNLRPPADLEPGRAYTVEWPRLRGVGTASRGNGDTVTFTVGDGPDLEAPHFDGLEKIFWDLDRDRDECTNSEQDRFYFDLTPGRVSDDSDTELLALRVFQTRGPTLTPGKRSPIALLPFPERDKPVRLELSVSTATGDVCFAAQVEDLKACEDGVPCANTSSADREICTTTTAPPFFYGCAIEPAGRDAPRSARAASRPWLFALLLLLAARRRHRAHS